MTCEVWWASRAEAEAADALAHDDERRRAARSVRQDDRDRSLLGSVLLRVAAAAALGVAADEVRLTRTCPRCGTSTAYDAHGRPGVADTGELGLSLAHAGDVVVVAVADAPGVGVDVEPVRPVAAASLADLLASDEPVPDAGAATTALWVRKESVLKATGAGLTAAPARVRLAPTERPDTWSSWCDGGPGAGGAGGTTWDLATAAGHPTSVTLLHPPTGSPAAPHVRRVRDVQFRP